METNWELEETVLDNIDTFQNSFFQRHIPALAHENVQLNDDVSKAYQFPTLYGNVSCSIGIFFCNYDRAQEILPNEHYSPVKMLKNRTVVIFSTYQYRDVLGVKSYNEIGMTIPVFYKDSGPAVLPLLKKDMKNFGYHVFSMPVTSYENQLRGLRIWGLPKVVERIDIEVKNGWSNTKAFDKDNKAYFELNIPCSGKKTMLDENNWLYSNFEGKDQITRSHLYGSFNVQKFSSRILFNKKSKHHYLIVGDSERANTLNKLEIDPAPLQLRYCENMSSSVYLPNTI
ncbi:MAG: acetoacetate decarboxylase family protein [Flavobacteriales bacterium]|nr:acetoacetate decarboxylase family protein [Flavobacteriales bacterium]